MMKNLPSHALTVVLTLAVAGAGSYVYHQNFGATPIKAVALNTPASVSPTDNAPPSPALVVTQNSPGVDLASAAAPDTITHLDPLAPVYSPPPGATTPSPWYLAYAAPAAASAQPQTIAGLETPLVGVISIPPVTPAPRNPPLLAYAPLPVAYAAPAPAAYSDYSGAYGGGGGIAISGQRTSRQAATTPYLDSIVFTGAPFSLAKVPTNAPIVIPPPGTTVGQSGTVTVTQSSTNGQRSGQSGSGPRRR